MTVAERTRAAVREEPFLQDALRAGVLNYTAAARYLDVGAEDAVSAALRRYEAELDPLDADDEARVTMETGLGDGPPAEALLQVGDVALVPGAGSLTGVLASGDVEPASLRRVLGRCETAGVGVEAAGAVAGTLLIVVGRRDGPDAVRAAEEMVAP